MDIHSLGKWKVSHAFPVDHGSRAAARLRQCCDACLRAPCSTSLSLPPLLAEPLFCPGIGLFGDARRETAFRYLPLVPKLGPTHTKMSLFGQYPIPGRGLCRKGGVSSEPCCSEGGVSRRVRGR